MLPDKNNSIYVQVTGRAIGAGRKIKYRGDVLQGLIKHIYEKYNTVKFI